MKSECSFEWYHHTKREIPNSCPNRLLFVTVSTALMCCCCCCFPTHCWAFTASNFRKTFNWCICNFLSLGAFLWSLTIFVWVTCERQNPPRYFLCFSCVCIWRGRHWCDATLLRMTFYLNCKRGYESQKRPTVFINQIWQHTALHNSQNNNISIAGANIIVL